MAGGRAAAGEYAARVNAAAELVEAGLPVAQAVRLLAGRFGCSPRQARRYLQLAARGGRVAAPAASMVFTVKLPAGLVGRVREQARASGRTISSLVAQALEEFLAGARRGRPGR